MNEVGWHRGGFNISYYANGIRKCSKSTKTYYTLTSSYEYEHDDDTVYFAYCYPYTYSNLLEELNEAEQHPERSLFTYRRTLCYTLAGNRCDYLTITNRSENAEQAKRKKGVVITARVHPGESVGSFMMRGVVGFLTDPKDREAQVLRDHFVFKVIPMLNPDGVINGNYRCSLAGCDLNRRWKNPSRGKRRA